MGVEIYGDLGSNDYKQKKLAQTLRLRDAEIKALKSQLEETKKAAEKKIDELERSVAHWKKRYSSHVKPRHLVETKAQAQGVRESVDGDPVSPSIST
jgi:hypothetical protein